MDSRRMFLVLYLLRGKKRRVQRAFTLTLLDANAFAVCVNHFQSIC